MGRPRESPFLTRLTIAGFELAIDFAKDGLVQPGEPRIYLATQHTEDSVREQPVEYRELWTMELFKRE